MKIMGITAGPGIIEREFARRFPAQINMVKIIENKIILINGVIEYTPIFIEIFMGIGCEVYHVIGKRIPQ
jgi:hypothetical protein